MLEVSGVSAGYGKRAVLHEVSLEAAAGDFVVLVGHNGAGKTTLLRTIVGEVPPIHGRVAVGGHDITALTGRARVQAGVAYVPQGRNVFPDLSVARNLALAGSVVRAKAASRAPEATLERVHEMFPVLEGRAGQAAGTLSGGEQQMLSIGMALMTDPQILLLDEPTTGLAPVLAQRVLDSAQQINSEFGVTVVLVEQQSIRTVIGLASAVSVMKSGRIVYAGPPEALGDYERLWELF